MPGPRHRRRDASAVCGARAAALALAALLVCTAPAPADPVPPAAAAADPAAHYLPADARDARLRHEEDKLIIGYKTSMDSRAIVGFTKKELRPGGWRVEWCNGSRKSTFCAISGRGKSAGMMTIEVEDDCARVILLLQSR